MVKNDDESILANLKMIQVIFTWRMASPSRRALFLAALVYPDLLQKLKQN